MKKNIDGNSVKQSTPSKDTTTTTTTPGLSLDAGLVSKGINALLKLEGKNDNNLITSTHVRVQIGLHKLPAKLQTKPIRM